jgi:endogenous inhibitor of DNA gyrase (YacG/DUF329 family)
MPNSPIKAQTRNVACAGCGKSIEHRTGRRPRFCSDRCRNREFGRTRVRKAFLAPDTGAPPKREKNSSSVSDLQRAKTQSRVEIIAPSDVLAIEVFDRSWRAATSSSGIAIEVGRLRQRVLVGSRMQP